MREMTLSGNLQLHQIFITQIFIQMIFKRKTAHVISSFYYATYPMLVKIGRRSNVSLLAANYP